MASSCWEPSSHCFVPLAIIIYHCVCACHGEIRRHVHILSHCPASVENHSWFLLPGTKDFLMEPCYNTQPYTNVAAAHPVGIIARLRSLTDSWRLLNNTTSEESLQLVE